MDRTFKTILILGVAAFFIWSYGSLSSSKEITDDGRSNFKGEITKLISEETKTDDFGTSKVQVLEVVIEEKDGGIKTIKIENDETLIANARIFKEGDKVLVTHYRSEEGSDTYYISDYLRINVLTWLFALFIVVVLIVTRWQGLGSILGMAISFAVIFKIILPLILTGTSPVYAAILGAIIIIPGTFYFSHGISRKTSVAVVGTLLTLIVTGLLAIFFAKMGHLTGLASEELTFLKLETKNLIDFSGLVLAGIIISILGIMDDITISQASVIQQLKNAKISIKFTELYGRGMTIGRDHIASMVNTLILVYAGASLPLLLVFMNRSEQFSEVINYEFIAQHVIETLVGSIGLIMAVPITTLLACLFLKKTKEDIQGHNHSH